MKTGLWRQVHEDGKQRIGNRGRETEDGTVPSLVVASMLCLGWRGCCLGGCCPGGYCLGGFWFGGIFAGEFWLRGFLLIVNGGPSTDQEVLRVQFLDQEKL